MAGLNFKNRVAIITGAGRGLGRAYALLLAQKGARLVINDPGFAPNGAGGDAGPAEEVVREIHQAGGEALACTDTVATPEGGKAIVEIALKNFGKIDILIHNAGNTRHAAFREMTNADFDAVLDVHLRGAFHVGQPAFAHMADAGYGRIVLTGSIAGLYGEAKVVNYSVAKAGLIGLCNVMALDGADKGIRCNVILPAALTRLAEGRDTSAYPPMGPEMVAPVVAWLAHESCSISGEMLISAAGRLARAYVAETSGLYRSDWTMESINEQIEHIRESAAPVVFPVLPHGFNDHLGYAFAMARQGGSRGGGDVN